jgi:hypothetical protein
MEGVVGTVGEPEFWAEASDAAVDARTKRSNHRIIPRVYNPSLRVLIREDCGHSGQTRWNGVVHEKRFPVTSLAVALWVNLPITTGL